MENNQKKNLAVLTSGGDAQGMNPALRSVVRTALNQDIDVYAIYEGYKGLVEGGQCIRKMNWDSVGGIIHQGGTVIGSARSNEFRTKEGRTQSAFNLLNHNIDKLIVIGGDGSLTGANIFRQEWPELLKLLVKQKKITKARAEAHPELTLVGLVGSIDNDMFGTDMTIGADTALHRITEAIDAITSTASSHQRSFVVEVMGRNCGYLALMSAMATGADWVLIPESPPQVENWEDKMCEVLDLGRLSGRRNCIVIVAEGAHDRNGKPISSNYVKQILEERLGEDTRVTILGHVQRGGSPSSYDRYLGTALGHAAVEEIIASNSVKTPQLIGIRQNRVKASPLMDCVEKTRSVADVIAVKDYEQAMEIRGTSFKEAFRTLRTLIRAMPHTPPPGQKRLRLAVMHGGGPAPGMNTAIRAAVRLGIDKGHVILGIKNGFRGFVNGEIEELNWMSVTGWTSRGGAELGTNRYVPKTQDFYAMARQIEEHKIEGILMIGGFSGYQSAYAINSELEKYPAFNIPIICLPASINNNLPGSELSVGCDSALNSIVEVVDKIKQSAVASKRCFVVEVMGHHCGYLALLSGLSTGAEKVYLHEEGVTLQDLQKDLNNLIEGFKRGKRLGLMIRSEKANTLYSTHFMCSLFEEEAHGLFDVRQAILGHLQQGGTPSPFDRIQATKLALKCIDFLIEEATNDSSRSALIGLKGGKVQFTDLQDFPRMVDMKNERPKDQWWLQLREMNKELSKSSLSI